MEVDGKPGVVSRRHDRGRQRPPGKGEDYLFSRGKAAGSRQALQRGTRRQGVARDRSFRRRQDQCAGTEESDPCRCRLQPDPIEEESAGKEETAHGCWSETAPRQKDVRLSTAQKPANPR